MLKSKRNLLAALSCALLLAGCKEEKPGVKPEEPPVPASLVLDADINSKTVLENRIMDPNIPDYVANTDVVVNAELEIKPGVVIAFARDTRLEISDKGGVLIAKGDSLHPVRLVGKEASKGFWAGIVLRSASIANQLEYVQIAHAGSKAFVNNMKAGMTVPYGSNASFSVKNSLFEQSGGYGLFVEQGVTITAFEKNTFSDNTEAGILVDAENVRMLDYNSVFTSRNGRNVVEIHSSAMKKNVKAEAVWSGFKDKTPYRVLEQLSVEANWKLMPGVTIELGRGARIVVDDGYLNAKGTPNSRITIRGVENMPGYWKGLIIFSTSDKNVFEHVDISGGGSTTLVSGKKANIAVYGNDTKLQIRNSRISNSTGYGIFVSHQASVNGDIEKVNTFEGNAEGKLFRE